MNEKGSPSTRWRLAGKAPNMCQLFRLLHKRMYAVKENLRLLNRIKGRSEGEEVKIRKLSYDFAGFGPSDFQK